MQVANHLSPQIVFSVSTFNTSIDEGEALLVALDLGVPNGTVTVFNETATGRGIDSLSYDNATGLIYGVSLSSNSSSKLDSAGARPSATLRAYLVAINSTGFSWHTVGLIGENLQPLSGYGVVGDGEICKARA